MKVIYAPEALEFKSKTIFLAGSIEQNQASHWQKEIIEKLKQYNYIVFNPRRKDWDATWKQQIEDPNFKQQVDWELDALERADIILMYFDPKTKSPISLLELGLFARSGKLLVCCPEGFWRKGNVDIVCQRYGIKQFQNLKKVTRHIVEKY